VRAEALTSNGAGWTLRAGAGTLAFDAVVLATPPAAASTLLVGLPAHPMPAFEYQPITTCFLQYDAAIALDLPFYALVDNPEAGEWGQFLFDRGQLDDDQPGLMAVVTSVSGAAAELDQDALAAAVARQLARALRRPELGAPLWTKVITEKRATFACTPGLVRPSNETGLPGVVLAGDYTAGDYPATLEGAVRSGSDAARLVLQHTAIA
jgi:predicted NAD/FAD-dependent oxidoreductase